MFNIIHVRVYCHAKQTCDRVMLFKIQTVRAVLNDALQRIVAGWQRINITLQSLLLQIMICHVPHTHTIILIFLWLQSFVVSDDVLQHL